MSSTPPIPLDDDSARPLVASPANNRSLWLFGIALIGGAILLFHTLDNRREALAAPQIAVSAERPAGFIASPPELELPSSYQSNEYTAGAWSTMPPFGSPASGILQMPNQQTPGQTATQRTAKVPYRLSPVTAAPYSPSASPVAEAMSTTQTPYMSSTPAAPPPEPPAIAGSSASETSKERVEATRFQNPGTTVPKGTVIQAVLETAVDSNRPGFARAIVSRDVLGFDGSRVLIPRGSRILGEYKSDIALGQNRVLIQWQRLTRPDGIIVNMDSPSADPLGRAGIRGKVNTHFFQRFAGAILQSALDIGTQLATREVSRDSIYIGLPGVMQGAVLTPEKIPPTIKVRQGTSVSVFVARDLDFTKVNP